VSEKFDPTTGPVYTGRNELRINQATMNRIVLEWLQVNHSGGPYKVIDVEADGDVFVVTFEDAPAKKGEGAACDDPNERDCEHGHKRGKCVACDLIESESRVRELKATLAARTKERDDLLTRCDLAEETADIASKKVATLRAECDRLRGLVRKAVAGMAKIADHGKGFTDEQMHLRIYAATYYRWAKDEAAALVARLGAE
jgi:hypothetical protein